MYMETFWKVIKNGPNQPVMAPPATSRRQEAESVRRSRLRAAFAHCFTLRVSWASEKRWSTKNDRSERGRKMGIFHNVFFLGGLIVDSFFFGGGLIVDSFFWGG